jgi:RHS repeat-associated protein
MFCPIRPKRGNILAIKFMKTTSLYKILLPNGYIQNNIYYFYLRDHLGNNCVTAKADGAIMQGLQYYPYGKVIEDESTGVSFQPYKYGGKEDEPMHGLGLLDFHARQLNIRDVPVFTTPDPLQEKYYSISPYSWCLNSPIRNIDPDGRSVYLLYYTIENKRDDEAGPTHLIFIVDL